MADSKINAFTPLSLFNSSAGTQTFIHIHSKQEFESFLFNSAFREKAIVFTTPAVFEPFPMGYGSGIILPCYDGAWRNILYVATDLYICAAHNVSGTVTYEWKKVTATNV